MIPIKAANLAPISETSVYLDTAVTKHVGSDRLLCRKHRKQRSSSRQNRNNALTKFFKKKLRSPRLIFFTAAKKKESKTAMVAFNANDSKWLVVTRILREYICLRCALAGIDDHPTVDLIMEQYISSFVAAINMVRFQLKQLKAGGKIIDPVNITDDVKPTSFLQMVSTVTPVVIDPSDPQFEAAAQFANALFTRFPFSIDDLRSLQTSLSGALYNDFFSLQLRNARLIQWTSTTTTYRNDDLEDYIAAITVKQCESQTTTLLSRHAAIAESASPSISTASDHAPSEVFAASLSIEGAGEVSNLRDGLTVSAPLNFNAAPANPCALIVARFQITYGTARSTAPPAVEPADSSPDPSTDPFNGAYMRLQVDDLPQESPPRHCDPHNPVGAIAISEEVASPEVSTFDKATSPGFLARFIVLAREATSPKAPSCDDRTCDCATSVEGSEDHGSRQHFLYCCDPSQVDIGPTQEWCLLPTHWCCNIL